MVLREKSKGAGAADSAAAKGFAELPNARFHVELEPFEGNAQGSDKITFLVSMNAGERLRPLQATANGGELSRFMLGLKTVFTRLTGIDTIIFDEIDTGVSGSVAFSIGKNASACAKDSRCSA